MIYKILIIDDNHSFIDSLKVMLKDFSFQYDSSFRFIEAGTKIKQTGSLLDHSKIDKLISLESQLKNVHSEEETEKKSSLSSMRRPKKSEFDADSSKLITEAEVIDPGDFINQDGYFLVIIEQDTETSMKGLEFIKNIVKNDSNWSENDFILMTNKMNLISPAAKAIDVEVVEKPIKANQIKQLISQKMQQVNKTIEKANILREQLPQKKEVLKAKEIKAKKTKATKTVKKKTVKKAVKKTAKKTVKKKRANKASAKTKK